MTNARIGKFYFEALDEIIEGLEMQIMDLDETCFKTSTTEERISALRKLIYDIDNSVGIKAFLDR